MILNMICGASKANVIDFTVDTDLDVATNYLTINNVRIPGATINGFFIYSTDIPLSSFTNGTVISFFYRSIGDGVYCVYTSGSSPAAAYSYSVFQYDSTNKTLQVKTSVAGAFVKAGNYQLVIW